jgi:hypothetical protein
MSDNANYGAADQPRREQARAYTVTVVPSNRVSAKPTNSRGYMNLRAHFHNFSSPRGGFHQMQMFSLNSQP